MSDPSVVARRGTALTPGELRVLEAMRDTLLDEDAAAQRLGISRNTVHAQLANARSRLGVRRTRDAIRMALS